MISDEMMAQLSMNLAEITVRNVVTVIADKIQKLKAKKDDKNTIIELEEIINSLLSDKMELIRIARSYEEEISLQKITEEDIEYITKNILPIMDNFITKDKKEIMDSLKNLISVETLTILQLIGFNYKKAIGEPLTLLLSKLIESKIPIEHNRNIEIALDVDAYNRYISLLGINGNYQDMNKKQDYKNNTDEE